MNKIALEIENLNQGYNSQSVLKNINMSVAEGEFVGLVGVNGAGKTTLIKAILDFISIDSGSIRIYGKTHLQTSAREAISFLPEKFIPPHYLTGKDFLSYMAELSQVKISDSNISDIFKSLDLDELALEKSVRQYSKGMAQKLGLASCFLSQRSMLLFDEPMSGLDPKARAYLKKHLKRLKELGMTLLFSTHLLADIESICDRIIVLHEGKVLFNGPPFQCCKDYEAENLEQAYLKCIGAND